jgi:DNA-binding transcriptional LysR family regulator
MDIHHLKIFVSVYRNKSFTKASEQLHISQPTISEHIKNLEKELNLKLFDRLGRSILPTQEAEALYPRALQLLDDLKRIQEEVTANGDGLKGKIIIGASTLPGAYLLPGKAHTFKQQFPETVFEILIESSKKITDMVLNHDLVCGIVGAKMESSKLNYTPLIEDELVLVAGKDMTIKKTIKPRELSSLPLLMREVGSGTRQTFVNYLKKKKIRVTDLNIVTTLGSTSAVKQAVKAGLGASILSRIAIQEELVNGSLIEIPIKSLQMKRKFYLVHMKKRSLPAQYLAFCQHMKENEH